MRMIRQRLVLGFTLITSSLTNGFLVDRPVTLYATHHHPRRSNDQLIMECATTSTLRLHSTPNKPDLVEPPSSTSPSSSVIEELNPRRMGLALQLDEGTRQSHSMAQNSAFVTGFFKGLSTKESYRNLITSLYFVYREMEDVFDQVASTGTTTTTTATSVQILDDPKLRRMGSLERDMDYFYGNDWKLSSIQPSPATQIYLRRIQTIANDPSQQYLLVAHQYTRYLGDLFGGQMMGGMARRSLDLPKEGEGTAFYTFDDISSVKDYITEWYTLLNGLDFTNEEKEKIVEEANLVFDLNIGILQELDGSPLLAIWTLAKNTLKMKLGLSS